MPISLSELKGKIRTINVTYYDVNLLIKYRPSALTPNMTSEIEAKIETGEAKNIVIEMLCNTMVEWDVVDDEGAMLAITPKHLGDIDGPLLLAIAEAIGEDGRPKPKSAKGSFAR